MKKKIPAPCEYFDIEADYPYPDADCYESVACDWYMEEGTPEEVEYDPQAPCKRRNWQFEDKDTIDIFGGSDA